MIFFSFILVSIPGSLESALTQSTLDVLAWCRRSLILTCVWCTDILEYSQTSTWMMLHRTGCFCISFLQRCFSMGFCRAVKWSRIIANFRFNPLPQPTQLSVGTMTDAALCGTGIRSLSSPFCTSFTLSVSPYYQLAVARSTCPSTLPSWYLMLT